MAEVMAWARQVVERGWPADDLTPHEKANVLADIRAAAPLLAGEAQKKRNQQLHDSLMAMSDEADRRIFRLGLRDSDWDEYHVGEVGDEFDDDEWDDDET